MQNNLFGITNCNGLSEVDTWPTLVSGMLNKKFESRVNLDFQKSVATQENTRGVLERLQRDILFANPDIITIQYGTNDSTYLLSNRGAPLVSQEAFRANLVELVDKCRLFDIKRLVFLTNHPVALERYDVNGFSPDENIQSDSTSACHLIRKAKLNASMTTCKQIWCKNLCGGGSSCFG